MPGRLPNNILGNLSQPVYIHFHQIINQSNKWFILFVALVLQNKIKDGDVEN